MKRRTRGVIAGTVLTLLVVAMAALGGTGASASTTRPSGTLSWDPIIGLPATWDPALLSGGGFTFQLALVYDSLTRLEPNGSAGPDLATSWKFINKGLTLQLMLRHGVKFSDGASFNASVVKLNLQREKTITGSTRAADLTPITSIQVVNQYEVRLHLSQYDYDLPLILGYLDGMMVSPKALENDNGAALNTTPVGSGPFIMTSLVPDGSATFRRNPNYWGAKDIHLAGVSLNGSQDASVALDGLESGQFQLVGAAAPALPATDIPAAKAAGFKVSAFPTPSRSDVAININVPPFNNPLLIKALNYATDRTALVKTLSGGVYQATTEVFSPGYPAYSSAAANLYPYNVAKAKELLAQAGYPNGITVTLGTLAEVGYSSVAELLQAQWSKAGITVNIDTLAQAAYSAQLAAGKLGIAVGSVGARADGVQSLLADYGTDSANNPCHCIGPALSQKLAALAKIPSSSPKYDTALQAATLAASENGPNIILFTVPAIYAYSKNLEGLHEWIPYQRVEGVSLH
jgi:peptide/nickel transport system substrate-binding protein